MDVLTESLRSACFHRCRHFVNNLRATVVALFFGFNQRSM
nr:gluconate 5-dehydrogenase [Yersinia thracica]